MTTFKTCFKIHFESVHLVRTLGFSAGMSEVDVSQSIIGRSVSLSTFCMALILTPSLNRVAPECRIEDFAS